MLKQYRLKNNLSQEELAEKVGISCRHLQRLEQNEENTRISTIKKIVKSLEIPDDEILKFIKKSAFTIINECLFFYKLPAPIIPASLNNFAATMFMFFLLLNNKFSFIIFSFSGSSRILW